MRENVEYYNGLVAEHKVKVPTQTFLYSHVHFNEENLVTVT